MCHSPLAFWERNHTSVFDQEVDILPHPDFTVVPIMCAVEDSWAELDAWYDEWQAEEERKFVANIVPDYPGRDIDELIVLVKAEEDHAFMAAVEADDESDTHEADYQDGKCHAYREVVQWLTDRRDGNV